MSWRFKAVVFFALGAFVFTCAWLAYAVHARYQGNEYVIQVAASFNAAALLNGEETYTEPDKAVISTWEGRRYVVLPENYKALVSLLRKDCAMPMIRRVGDDAPLAIDLCDSVRLRIEPDPDSVDGALVAFAGADGRRFTMHVRGGNIWKGIVEYATVGRPGRRNIPL